MQKVSNKKANVCPKKKKVIIHMYIRVGISNFVPDSLTGILRLHALMNGYHDFGCSVRYCIMYEWNCISYHIMMVINVLLIQSEGYSFEAYQVSDICFVLLHPGDTGHYSEFCYVRLCEFDSLNFYVYMFYGVLFDGP